MYSMRKAVARTGLAVGLLLLAPAVALWGITFPLWPGAAMLFGGIIATGWAIFLTVNAVQELRVESLKRNGLEGVKNKKQIARYKKARKEARSDVLGADTSAERASSMERLLRIEEYLAKLQSKPYERPEALREG